MIFFNNFLSFQQSTKLGLGNDASKEELVYSAFYLVLIINVRRNQLNLLRIRSIVNYQLIYIDILKY